MFPTLKSLTESINSIATGKHWNILMLLMAISSTVTFRIMLLHCRQILPPKSCIFYPRLLSQSSALSVMGFLSDQKWQFWSSAFIWTKDPQWSWWWTAGTESQCNAVRRAFLCHKEVFLSLSSLPWYTHTLQHNANSMLIWRKRRVVSGRRSPVFLPYPTTAF